MVKIHYFGTEQVEVTCDVDVVASSINGEVIKERKTMSKRMLLDEGFDGKKGSEMFSLLREDFEQRVRESDFSDQPNIHAIIGVKLVTYKLKVDDLIHFE